MMLHSGEVGGRAAVGIRGVEACDVRAVEIAAQLTDGIAAVDELGRQLEAVRVDDGLLEDRRQFGAVRDLGRRHQHVGGGHAEALGQVGDGLRVGDTVILDRAGNFRGQRGDVDGGREQRVDGRGLRSGPAWRGTRCGW